MIRVLLFSFCAVICIHHALVAQVSVIRQVQSRMEKGKWGAAKQLLQKSLLKDSSSIESKFTLAQWFFAKSNPNNSLDSAHYYVRQTLKSYGFASSKQIDRLKRLNLDSGVFINFQSKIDSTAFEYAKQFNTEQSYNDFLLRFPHAKEKLAATELRDEISFVEALKHNTWKSFQMYIYKYPASQRKMEAKRRYEKLFYEDQTKDHRLASYQHFVSEYPSSPYATEAERQIYEISTADGSVASFSKYIRMPGNAKLKKEAQNILFHLITENEEKISEEYLNDSLREVIKSTNGYWVPYLDKGRYGFLDSLGNVIMTAQLDSIEEEYRCGNIRFDIIKTSQGLVSRQAKRISGRYSRTQDIGYGFLKVGDSLCFQLMHKSGRIVIPTCEEDFQIVGGSFISVRHKGRWGIYSMTGRMLLPATYESIQVIENIVVLTHLEKRALCVPAQLATIADGNPLRSDFVFDEVRSAQPGLLLVRNGSLEGILNAQLEFVVPLDRQSLSLTQYGMLRKIDTKFRVSGISPEFEKDSWDRVSFYKQWLQVWKLGQHYLFDLRTKRMISEKGDSIWFDKGIAFVKGRDSTTIHLNTQTHISIPNNFQINFVKAADSIQFFSIDSKKKKSVFDIVSGSLLFVSDYDQIESLTAKLFLVSKKNRFGLLSRDGKTILPLEYNVIIKTGSEVVSLLKDKKFGLYDFKRGLLVKPNFDRNVIMLENNMLVVFKDNFYGIMDWDGKPLTKFEFDEIRLWEGSRLWMKKKLNWQLTDIRTGNNLIDKVKDFRLITHSTNDKVALVQRENYYGIVSSSRGIIIPPTFTSIVNIGSDEFPFYFTDKEVEEAGVHVVIYYNREGKYCRKQVYEEEEFERIVCEAN